jgi:hypothetical protein
MRCRVRALGRGHGGVVRVMPFTVMMVMQTDHPREGDGRRSEGGKHGSRCALERQLD